MRQLFQEFVVAKRKREEEMDRDLVLAWHTAAMVRAKKLPDIKQLLAQRKRGPLVKQTRTEAEAAFRAMANRLQQTPRQTRLIHVGDKKHG